MIFACLLAIVWIGACAVSALPLFVPPDRRPTWSEVGLSAAVGATALGVAWGIGFTTVPHWAERLVMGGLLLAAAATILWRRRSMLWPAVGRPGPAALVSTLAMLCWLSTAVSGAALMGTGAYPSAFFHVDTPYRLTHVRVLQESGTMPPRSLSNAGLAPAYHYGAPAVAAALGALSDLPAHTALFAVALPLGLVGLFCASRVLAALAAPPGSMRHAIFSAFVLTAWSGGMLNGADAVWRVVMSGDAGVLQSFVDLSWHTRETFGNHFPDVAAVYGRLLLMATAPALFNPSGRYLWSAVAAVVLLGQVRAGVAMIAAITLGAACAVDGWRRQRVTAIGPAAAAAGGALLLMSAAGSDNLYPYRILIEPAWIVRHFPGVLVNNLIAVVVLAGGPLIIARGYRRPGRDLLVPGVVAVAAIYGLYQLVGAEMPELVWDTKTIPTAVPMDMWVEPLADVPVLLALLGITALGASWAAVSVPRRCAAMALIAALAVPPLAHRLYGSHLMLTDPVRAHEYADNQRIAAALRSIPLAGSIVATNDLRYPAGTEMRELRQYQLPAIFGHQAFAAPGYARYPGWIERVDLQQRLASTDVSCATLRRLADAGVTHLLIHKTIAHPASLPLRQLYADEAYSTFELRRADIPC